MLDTLTLAVVDLETTGGSAAYDRIIEIGIKRIEAGRVVASYSSLVDPECRIPEMITQLTGITNDDVEDAPVFSTVAREVAPLLDGGIFVAHNARFDYGFLRNEFERLGTPFTATCLCTVRLSRLLHPDERHHDLSTLIERHRLPCPRRHRALDDAEAAWALLTHLHRTTEPARFADAVASLLKRPTLPPQLPAETLERLPAGPGVYIFYDAGGVPLYVGKSVEIRDRVLSHFASDHRSSREMQICQQLARIETQPTYGELGALLLESHLIKSIAPLYNRLSRARRELVVACQGAPWRGYETTSVEGLQALDVADQGRILGVFHSKKQAKDVLYSLAKEHALCPKLLGLEPSDGGCFNAQLNYCHGACTGRERALLYNTRFAEAFATRRIKTWPYRGPVMLEEHNRDQSAGHVFIVDRWRVVQAFAYDEAGRRPLLAPQRLFDYDSYKILARHLLTRRSARPLTPREAEALSP